MTDTMPNARLSVHDGAGHMLWLDDPARVAGEIRALPRRMRRALMAQPVECSRGGARSNHADRSDSTIHGDRRARVRLHHRSGELAELLARLRPAGTGLRWREPGDEARLVVRLMRRDRTLVMTLVDHEPNRVVRYRTAQAGLPDLPATNVTSSPIATASSTGSSSNTSHGVALPAVLDRTVVRRSVRRAADLTLAALERELGSDASYGPFRPGVPSSAVRPSSWSASGRTYRAATRHANANPTVAIAANATVATTRNAPSSSANAAGRSDARTSSIRASCNRVADRLVAAPRVQDDRPRRDRVRPQDDQPEHRAEQHDPARDRADGRADQQVDDQDEPDAKLERPEHEDLPGSSDAPPRTRRGRCDDPGPAWWRAPCSRRQGNEDDGHDPARAMRRPSRPPARSGRSRTPRSRAGGSRSCSTGRRPTRARSGPGASRRGGPNP